MPDPFPSPEKVGSVTRLLLGSHFDYRRVNMVMVGR